MIEINNKADCCGCTACAAICAHDAIRMQPDVLGFLYPKVDKSKCVDCGLCEKVCAFHENYDKSFNLLQPDVYGARHKDMNEISSSRSGASFVAISDYILENKGIVYGVGYADHFRVVHKRAITKEDRNEFKGSKYVQSDLTGIFCQVKKDLKNGNIVLFSGTPCQTAGLSSFVGKKLRKNLYLIDIVCHGVPSPYIWRDYLSYLEKKYKSQICYVNFRDKEVFGWKAHKETFKFINSPKKFVEDIFTRAFYLHIMLRHSCGSCKYCNLKRPSDITLGDFWRWEKTDLNINADDKGISLVLCNSEKGQKIFNSIKGRMDVIPVRLEDCLQRNLIQPTSIHPKRISFECEYAKKGFLYVMTKYGVLGWKYRRGVIMKRIEKLVKFLVKN